MPTIPERFTWAAQIMDINPGDNLLEIGCGAGLLAEVIAGQIHTGKLLAIDKSASMIDKAKKRNKRYLDRGIANFMVTDFAKSKLPFSHFDHVVAFNVNMRLRSLK